MGYVPLILAPFCLAAGWYLDEPSFRTRLVFLLLYAASFLLLLLPQPYAFVAVQCLLCIVFGGATFGLDWLSRGPGI
jgi:hypothetical protein